MRIRVTFEHHGGEGSGIYRFESIQDENGNDLMHLLREEPSFHEDDEGNEPEKYLRRLLSSRYPGISLEFIFPDAEGPDDYRL